jgi:NitT/TauT family transport system substrate-binding protein
MANDTTPRKGLSGFGAVARLITVMQAVLLLAPPAGRAADKLHVAKPEATTFAFAFLDIGIAAGIFARHGIEIESLDLGGAAKAHQSLIAGSADIELGSGIEFMYLAKGSPAKGVAVLAGAPLGMCLMVRDDGALTQSADLKGKLVGISSVGSLTDWLAAELSRRQGWGSDGVTRVALGNQDALSAALIAKNIDAIVGGTQTGYRLQETGRGKVLTTFGPLVPDFITHMILASDAFISNHPDRLRDFLAAWFETVRFAKANKDDAIRYSRPLTRLTDETASAIYDSQIAMFSLDGRFEPKALEVTKQAVRELGQIETLPADGALFSEEFLPRN